MMNVSLGIVQETWPHKRRVAVVPSVVPTLIKRGAKARLQAVRGLGAA